MKSRLFLGLGAVALLAGGWYGTRPQEQAYLLARCTPSQLATEACALLRETETHRPLASAFGVFTKSTTALHSGSQEEVALLMSQALPWVSETEVSLCLAEGMQMISQMQSVDPPAVQSVHCKFEDKRL